MIRRWVLCHVFVPQSTDNAGSYEARRQTNPRSAVTYQSGTKHRAQKCYLFCGRQADVPSRHAVSRCADCGDPSAPPHGPSPRPPTPSLIPVSQAVAGVSARNWVCDRPPLNRNRLTTLATTTLLANTDRDYHRSLRLQLFPCFTSGVNQHKL